MSRRVYTLLCIVMGLLSPGITTAQLTADFSSNITSGCSPILVQFSDLSTGNPLSWTWNLGNGTISSLQNPSTTYIIPGTYTVSLTVGNGSGTNTKTITSYITVTPTPVVNFIANDTLMSCPPKTVQFTNLSTLGTAGGGTYFWDFGDGTTSTSINPVHTYNASGNFNVTLQVTNSTGCSKILVKNQYIHLNLKPVADFASNNNNSCNSPTTVNFNNNSTGAVSYQWNFGDGGTSTGTNPSHSYSTGSYTVTLIATNASGCKDTIVKPAFVNIGSLNASFTKSTATACVGTDISFTNTSTPGPGNSTWHFGDGTTSNSTNAVHAYSTAGTYSVKLKVNYNNCSDSAIQTVTINPAPNAQFTASPLSSCSVPLTVQFTNSSTGASSYLWKFTNTATSAATNPSYTYNSFGSKTVTLIAYGANGCNDTLVKPAYINISQATMELSANPVNGCAPSAVSFTTSLVSSIPASSYTWHFGDGTVVSGTASMNHTYTTAGTFSAYVTFTTAPGCAFTSDTIKIHVGILPNASFTAAPTTICPNQSVTFTNTSTGATGTTYKWFFGDGGTSLQTNPTHTYTNYGLYTVMLVANNNGCKDTMIITNMITVNLPKALFTPSYFCNNRKKVSFTDNSIGANSWSWDFDDGGTSTLQNPTHVYSSYGTYNVTLTVTNLATGCTATYTLPVVLFDLTTSFAASDTVLCKGEPTTFTAQLLSPAAGPYTLSWQLYFGDGSSQAYSGLPVVHTYTSAGIYTVKMVIMDSRGCIDSTKRTNYIHVDGVTADFTGTPTSGCAPLTVNFTDQSSSVGGAITSRLWKFGDGTTLTGNVTNPGHTYSSGTYTVKLIATNASGCTDTMVKTDYISASKPTASFTSSDTSKCAGLPVHFVNSSTGGPLSYNWLFGDGGTSTASNPNHIYAAPGNYTVTLIVTNSNTQCKDTLTRIDYIHILGMNLGFTMSDSFATCPPLSVIFTNTSTGPGTYSWSFGNGNTSVLNSPTTLYTIPGVYTVKLTGQNTSGCLDSTTMTVTVLGPYGTLSYSPLNGCAPLTVQFSSTNSNTQLLIWDMDNGVTQNTTASGTAYTYTQPGSYLPKLLLSDGLSCIVPILGTDTIKVGHLDVDFSFTPNNICQAGTVSFTDTVLFSMSPVTSRSWNFGDGGTSTQHNPTHTYTAPGTYNVTFIMTTALGCIDTMMRTVEILAPPIVGAGNNVNICQGQTTPVQLQAAGGVNYSWSPSTTLSCGNCANPLATVSGTTTYTVIGTASNGCSDTSQVTVTVDPLPNITTGSNPTICSGASVQLAASGGQTYSWSSSTGLSCTNCSNPVASPAATTTYTVTGTSAAGCSNTATVTVNVSNAPNVTASTAAGSICAGDSTQLQAAGAATYSWTPVTGLSCITCANPVANPATTTTYVVSGSNGNGCTDTGAVTIIVNPPPAVNPGASISVCSGTSTQLQATGATNYNWSPATGLSCTSCANPVASPLATTTYTLTGNDINGCTNTGFLTVTVNAPPVISANAPQVVCQGSSVSLVATGAQTYSWQPSTGLSCTLCANPNASPAGTTTYTVIGTDVNGCNDTTQAVVNVNPKPLVDAGPDQEICKLTSAQLQAAGALSYVWSPATSLSCTSCPDPLANPTNATTYTVTGTDSNGCTNTDNVQVSIHPQPVINAGADITICRGQSAQLQATGAQTYTWSPTAGLSCVSCSNPLASPTTDITYVVTGTDANGCSDSDQVSITVIQVQPFIIGPGDTLCKGESAQLSAGGGEQYLWIPATGLNSDNIPNPIATPDVTTTYFVIIKQGLCFSDTGKVTIVVHPQPTVNAGTDQTVLAGSVVNLFADATNTTQYLWTPSEDLSCSDCASPVVTPKRTTTYTVYVSNQFGCKATDDVTLFVRCDNSLIFLANTFTPNGDGNNDRFYPQGKGISNVQRFRIYNRWGELMFDVQNISLNDESHGWDGTYKGEPLKPDVYVYIVDGVCEAGDPIQIKGDVSLIR